MGRLGGIDECNRALNGADLGVNTDFPIQLTDFTNVPAEGQGYDIGYDFRQSISKCGRRLSSRSPDPWRSCAVASRYARDEE